MRCKDVPTAFVADILYDWKWYARILLIKNRTSVVLLLDKAYETPVCIYLISKKQLYIVHSTCGFIRAKCTFETATSKGVWYKKGTGVAKEALEEVHLAWTHRQA